jgi:Na+-translocating ferredoxin:NAD+ oxidoreductase RNF subunit RnfB
VNSILLAAATLAGLGFFFAALLAVAHRFLHVEEDPRLDEIEARLPGSNCGACGSPGCRAFAERLLAGKAAPSQCTVSAEEATQDIAEFLGVDAGVMEKRVARLHCAGGRAQALQIAEYEGMDSCRGAHVLGGGGKGCSWGCLGLADCEVACDFDAIRMNSNGLPVVDIDKCTACGDCVDACPRDLFEIAPLSHALLVQCKIPLAGELARSLCSVACDGCTRCVQDAAAGLVHMENDLPVVDYAAGGPARPEATFRCPTGAIRWVPFGQFAEDEPEPVVVRQARGRFYV